MLHPPAFFCLLVPCLLLAACGGGNRGLLRLDPGQDQTGPSPLVTGDPAGPIPAPNLPPELKSALAGRSAPEPPRHGQVPAGQPGEGSSASAPSPAGENGSETAESARHLQYTLEVISEKVPEIAEAFLASSLLERMRANPPSTLTGLDQRMRGDLDLAKDVLNSYGYHGGEVRGKIREKENGLENNTYAVTITFTPGEQYTVGKTRVRTTAPSPLPPEAAGRQKRRLPAATLADVGLKEGDPALADNVLDAVSAVRENFRDRGYPFAEVVSSKFTVDRSAKTLDADVLVDSGPLAYMGNLEIKGESPVTEHYLESLRTWEPGSVWNQRRVDRFRDALRQSGLFASAEINPSGHEDENGRRNVVTELTPSPARTIGGALKFDTDFGPGIQGYWENRNLTGRGDRLRIEAPVWADLQELAAAYRLPFFLRDDQTFIAGAGLRSENTDAYELKSARGSAGLERRFGRRWSGTLSVMSEGGSLKEPEEPRRDYFMVGLPGSLTYNGANDLLNATRGFRVMLDLAPYTGEFNGNFTTVRSRVETQAFFPVIGEDSLVMAFRAMYGFLNGEEARNLPASLRFYAGGGGSVRGYAHQSLGPRSPSRDPLGGSSAVEVGAEARMRFNETFGLVAFLDGGMAYEDNVPDFGDKGPRWGAGLGLRLFTAIGPIRFDIGVPLNKRHGDDNFQIYLSIGQSF